MQSLLLAVVGLLCLFSVESVMSRSRRGKKVDYKALHEGTTSTIGRIMDPEVQLLDYDDEFVGVEASASVSREQDMSASGNGGVSSPDETTESEKGSGEEFDTCGDGSEEEEDPDIRCADEEIKELRRQIRRERKQRLLDRKNQEIEQLRQELSSIRIRDQEQETGKRGRRQVRGIKDSNKKKKNTKKGINMSLDVDLRELRERNKKSGKAREMWCEKSESSEFDEGDSCGEDEEVENTTMMPLIQGLRILNLLSVSLFLICCYHMLANTQKVPPGGDNIRNGGALTLVPQDPTDDADVTVESSEEIEEDVPSMDVFYPTKEWKTVKKGQAVPAGLHIRMNLETGDREAKLMEGDSESKYWKSGDKEGMVNPNQKSFTPQQLKEALKEFKTTKLDEQDNDEREKEVFKSFRKYDEIKKELADMNTEIKTDAEIVTQMFHRLNSTDLDGTQKKHLLEDLEYYLHQIDNANVFCNLGGMTLLMQGLNDSVALTREQSAFVIGSAVQSNPAAQIKALEVGILPQLIRLLSTEQDDRVLPRLLYALSSLIRHFPFAQKRLLDLGGLAALKNILPNNKDLSNLKVKVVTLLQDLIVEKDFALSNEDINSEKVQQYKRVNLQEAIKEQGLCVWLPRLLEATDHDSREKVLQAMLTFKDTCQEDIWSALPTLKKLLHEYTHLAAEEIDQDDQYFSGIAQYITQIISSSPSDSKDEL